MGWWDSFVVWLLGKDIAILGPRSSGKTTLQAYFEGRALPRDYEPTLAATPTPPIRHSNAGFRIRKGLDLPGGQAHYPDWRKQFLAADVVFYLFDVTALQDPRLCANLRDDSKKIKQWSADNRPKQLHLLGTHADLDPRFKSLGQAKYSDELRDEDVLIAVEQRLRPTTVSIGSLKTSQDAQRLLRPAVES